MKRLGVFFVILFIFGSYGAAAEEVQVSGLVDKTRAAIDEEISFTVRVLGARGNLQAPRLPVFDGFDSFYTGRTSQFTFINGKSSATVEFSYVLVPKVAGRFTLAPVQMGIDGKTYSTHPLQVEIIGAQMPIPAPKGSGPSPGLSYSLPSSSMSQNAAAPAQTTAGQTPQFIEDGNVFVKAAVDKKTVFPNEQVLLTYTLYTRYDTRYEGFEEEPAVTGFWIEDFPLDRDLGRDEVTYQGKRYVKADVRKIALFPTAPAEYTIQPGVVKVSVREEPKTTGLFDEFFGDSFFAGSSFFARRAERLLKPDPLTIIVRPYPENGKPASFNGAVGEFRLEAAVDKREVKQNEPVTLTLTLEGDGNIETLPRPPVPELTGFKTYDGDTQSQLLKRGTTLGGKKTFEIIFIPTEAGEMAIPPMSFSFFNPTTQNYKTLRSPTFSLKAEPSNEPLHLPADLAQREGFKKEVRLEGRDIRYLHEDWPSERAQKIPAVLFFILSLANGLGLGLVGNGLLRSRREALFARDIAFKRRRLARSLARERLKVLKQLVKSKKPEEALRFMEEAEKILSDYLSNKFNVSSYDFTEKWLEEKLGEVINAEDPLHREIREFYLLSREARFGGGALPAEERKQYFDLIEKVIQRLEKPR